MKQNTFTKMLAAGAACALALGTALAQEASTTTTTSAGSTGVSTTTSTSSLDATGTITAFTPSSDYIIFRTETSAEPVRYYVTKETTVVDPSGAPVELSMLRPDMPVRYTYVKQGDRMIVTKVTLEKPVSYYKKETTTTTTTSP
jgi:hypothetical protein